MGLREGRAPGAEQALREGQDVAVERRDRPPLGHRGRPSSKVVAANALANPAADPVLIAAQRHPSGRSSANWGDEEWGQFVIETQNWTLSQFMHGEQGALICTAKIVETVPWIDAKYYASTQVMDEARHVEVFAKYLRHQARPATTRSTPTSACCSTTSSPTAAGT